MRLLPRAAIGCLLSAVLAAGCGEQPASPPEPPARTAQAPATSTPPRPAPEQPAGDGSNGGKLTAVEPEELPGDAVPVEYLPPDFPLPKEAEASEGFGKPKPVTGQFYLRLDASVEEVAAFFEREYEAEGWKKIKDETSEEDGAKGFDLLFTKKNSQVSAGFTGEEQRGRVVVQVYYNDATKL